MVTDSRCRRLYALSNELVWCQPQRLCACFFPGGSPDLSGGGHGGVIGSYIARIGKSTGASFTTSEENASTLFTGGLALSTRKAPNLTASQARKRLPPKDPARGCPSLRLGGHYWETSSPQILGIGGRDEHHAFTHSSYALDLKRSGVSQGRERPHGVFRFLQLVRSSDTPSELSKPLSG